jgi:hypothetical protein
MAASCLKRSLQTFCENGQLNHISFSLHTTQQGDIGSYPYGPEPDSVGNM